jgi:translation initiation factor IF-2
VFRIEVDTCEHCGGKVKVIAGIEDPAVVGRILVQPEELRARIQLWAEEEIRRDRLPPKSGAILEAVLYRGELPRGDAAAVVGTGDRQARRVVSALLDRGVLTSTSTRAALRLAFPAALASRWMPGLFPEQT